MRAICRYLLLCELNCLKCVAVMARWLPALTLHKIVLWFALKEWRWRKFYNLVDVIQVVELQKNISTAKAAKGLSPTHAIETKLRLPYLEGKK